MCGPLWTVKLGPKEFIFGCNREKWRWGSSVKSLYQAWKGENCMKMNHYFEGVVLRKDVAAAGNSQASLSECHECNTVFLHHNLVEQPTKSYKSECHSWIALNCCASQASLCLFLRLKCICQFRPDTPNFLPFLTIQLNSLQRKKHTKVNALQLHWNVEHLSFEAWWWERWEVSQLSTIHYQPAREWRPSQRKGLSSSLKTRQFHKAHV